MNLLTTNLVNESTYYNHFLSHRPPLPQVLSQGFSTNKQQVISVGEVRL